MDQLSLRKQNCCNDDRCYCVNNRHQSDIFEHSPASISLGLLLLLLHSLLLSLSHLAQWHWVVGLLLIGYISDWLHLTEVWRWRVWDNVLGLTSAICLKLFADWLLLLLKFIVGEMSLLFGLRLWNHTWMEKGWIYERWDGSLLILEWCRNRSLNLCIFLLCTCHFSV